MKIAPLPEDEASRLAALKHYEILDTLPEEAFDDLTALAAQISGTPIALVSLIDTHRQWFKAKVGADATETPREIAFCAHAILQQDILIVPDALHDERFADNPLVTRDPNIRFYAGVPLITPTGHVMGTLCVIDRVPRQLTPSQQEALRRLGRQAVRLMEFRIYDQKRKQAEAALRESEEKYRGLFESSPDAIMLLFPPEWNFTACNPATVELFGANSAAHFTTLGPWEVSPEHQPDGELSSVKARQAIETARQQGSHFFEWTHKKINGPDFSATVLLTQITLQGKLGLQATVRDVSEQKRAEKALREQMQLSLLATDINSALVQGTTLPAMLQQCTAALIRHLDAAFARIWLLNPGDLCGECHKAAACANRTECLHLTASAGLSENLNGEFRRVPLGALKIGKIAQGWGTMTTNDVVQDDRLPNKQWLKDNGLQAFAGYPLTVGTRVVGVMALFSRHLLSSQALETLERIAQVISLGVERKQTEEALQASEERLTLTIQGSNIGIWDWNLNTNAVYFSPLWKSQLGYEDHEIVNALSEWESRLHPDDRDTALHKIQSFISGWSVGFELEYRLRHKDGSYRWILSRGSLIRDMYGIASRIFGIHFDTTESKRAQEALRSSSAFQKAMLDNAGHAIISTTPEGITQVFNPAAESLLGYRAEELIGKQTPALFHDPEEVAARARLFSAELGIELQPGFDVFVEKSRRNLPNEHEWTYIRKDGTRLTVLLNVTALRNADGQISGFLGIASNITLLKVVEQELTSAKDAAEAASIAKSQFLANMSHEIRTPMNGVLGMAELLLNSHLTEKQRYLADSVHRSGTALLSIINDILDFSKIEAGKLELEHLEFGLRETVEEAVDLFAEPAGKKGLNLTCFLPEEIPDSVIGDPVRLRQVLLNLVGNAVKFTQRGDVAVWLHLLAQDARTLTLKCEVTDTGIGIPPQAQTGLFTAFSQADGSTTRRFGGTGLGLTIVKQLVQLMGGEVGIASTPGQGSTFWFTMRLSCAAPRNGSQPASAQFLSGTRVLIVDDNPTNRFILDAQLTSWGAEAISADSGAAALALLKQYANTHTPIDMAILDIQMPDMDGLMLARAIKANPIISGVGLLALSSMDTPSHSEKTEPLGFVAWLRKPVRQSLLRDCLRRHCQGVAAAPSADGPKPLASPATSGRVLLVEDNPVNREVATGMLELLGYHVDIAEDGQQALAVSATGSYDAILMDCQMPVMDGFMATAHIRERERQANAARIPIIALTANAMEGDREQCLAAGMDDYLSKPFTLNQLKDILSRWFSQTNAAPSHGDPGSASAGTAATSPAPTTQAEQIESSGVVDCTVWEPIRMLKRPGHPDPLGQLLARYLEDSRQLVDQLRHAIQSNDPATLHAVAHRLKSSSATLGALTVAARCKELEALGRSHRIEGASDQFRQLARDFDAVCSVFEAELKKETPHDT